jgi:magnesium chelatase family protein
MTIAIAYSRALLGIRAPEVAVETHLSNGLPAFNLVGLPETSVRESKERVRSAILNSGFEFPNRRITVNLAPADLPKEGTRYDAAIALSILSASAQLPAPALAELEIVAELALAGGLRGVRGAMPAALAARHAGRQLVVAPENAAEAALVDGLEVYGADSLHALADHLTGLRRLAPSLQQPATGDGEPFGPDLADVHGQHFVKRALEVAAAGGHNLLMCGPPGTGKTMLAARLPGLLPPLDDAEAFEVATVCSVTGQPRPPGDWRRRPFRAPHHTSSAASLVGGGNLPRPGEVSLAHHGVLFLDELPEFGRRALEVLREPLECGTVTIARAAATLSYPARFQLVATMNPCPCGYAGDALTNCTCSAEQVRQYRARLSGPLLDRIDLQAEVPRERDWLRPRGQRPAESSATVRARVGAARAVQWRRQGKPNARLSVGELQLHAPLDERAQAFLAEAFDHFRLSARSYHRVIKVARSIADLAGRADVAQGDLAEALTLRRMERARA